VIKRFSFILTIALALALAVLFASGNAVQAQMLLTASPTPSPQIQPPYVHCTAASPSVCYVVPTIVQCTIYEDHRLYRCVADAGNMRGECERVGMLGRSPEPGNLSRRTKEHRLHRRTAVIYE
jgi:hypothetical protein